MNNNWFERRSTRIRHVTNSLQRWY